MVFYIFLTLFLIIMATYIFNLFGKMDIKDIIIDYMGTFYNFQNDKISYSDIFIFIILPAIISIIAPKFFVLKKEFIGNLLTVFSIFLGLMLNLLLIVLDLVQKTKEKLSEKNNNILKLLKELFYSISFSILTSILLVITSLLLSLDFSILNVLKFYWILKYISSCWIYFLIILFCLDMFIILKRVHIILKREISKNIN